MPAVRSAVTGRGCAVLNGIGEMVASATGHKVPTPILSVRFVRATMAGLRLDRIDPSDAMANFTHAMRFTKTTGFGAVEALVAD